MLNVLETFNDSLLADDINTVEAHQNTRELLENYATTIASYNSNALYLLDKIRGTAQLLADTLNLKHQQTAQLVSQNTLALNQSAARDSATIRVVTVVTLIYLPANFVAVSFESIQQF